MTEGLTYRDAGVDVDAGNRAVDLMKQKVRSTYRPEVLGDIGGFAGCVTLPKRGYQEPVLVSGTDGVGTKLKLAFQADRHHTVGQDLVAMCVNDILVQGAEPLFLLDYLACGRLIPEKVATVVGGIADGCRLAGCALIGGETAEMPGFYQEGEYDLAGFAVGVAERSRLIDGSSITAGDVILGLRSSGLHSNGYSLTRRIFDLSPAELTDIVPWGGCTWADELLVPTRIYVKTVLPLLERFSVKGMVHITGGGFIDNVPRVLPSGLDAEFELGTWPIPAVFDWLRTQGNVEPLEMFRTYNMGIGFMLVVDEETATAIQSDLAAQGEPCDRIGRVIPGGGHVRLLDQGAAL
ncbi:MAG: phosphoribosylformylglycinamidine cyclo-ligase [Bacillota bacterium]